MSIEKGWVYGPNCHICDEATINTSITVIGVVRGVNLPAQIEGGVHPNKHVSIPINYCTNQTCSNNLPKFVCPYH